MRWNSIAAAAVLALILSAWSVSAAERAGPRDGKYTIYSYGRTSAPPLVLGSFVIEGNKYTAALVGGRETGSGDYTYDAATKTVTWASGPYKGEWGGAFSVEREGKTHRIELKPRTIATNSTDTDK